MHIHGAVLDGRRVVTDFGEYALADGEEITSREQLRDVLATQYRRWDEYHWSHGAWGNTPRAEFERIADANEARLRSAVIRADADPSSLLKNFQDFK